jgi:hypothetical protein
VRVEKIYCGKIHFRFCRVLNGMPDTQTVTESLPEEVVADEGGAAEPEAVEYGGPKGREPTRYGDWEKNGRCIDF